MVLRFYAIEVPSKPAAGALPLYGYKVEPAYKVLQPIILVVHTAGSYLTYILFNNLIYFRLPKRSLRIASFCNYLRADKPC
jgi:hypothetical protein